MAFDTKKWLIDDMGFTTEEAEALAPQFSARGEKIEKGYLRQSDYSKQMNAGQAKLDKAQADYAAANAKLNDEMAEWASLTAAEKAAATKLKDDLDASQLRIANLTTKLTRLATDAGIDPKTVIGDEPPITPKPAVVAPPDLSGYAKNENVGAVANLMMDFAADLPVIMAEYQHLTGESLSPREFKQKFMDALKKESITPQAFFERTYDIGAKRAEFDKAERAKEISAAEQRGRESALSEAALPNTLPVGRTSPVFKTDNVTKGSKLQRPQPSTRLTSAVSALATGKYRKAS